MDDFNEKEIMYKLGEMHGDIRGILREAKKTNGRLRKAEAEIDELREFVANFKGKVAVISAIVAVAMTILSTIIVKIINNFIN